MEALLEYRQTDVCYGGVRAVRGVSFTLHAGEILGVVGESGCGKSTLLRAAMGLLGPGGLVTGGKILYRGENLPDLSHRARRRLNGPELGMIFQSAGSAFCPVRRVGDQLYEMMRAHGPMDKRAFRQQAGALLDRLGLEDGPRILNSYPFELSGGMQQRVGIAAAMLLRPGCCWRMSLPPPWTCPPRSRSWRSCCWCGRASERPWCWCPTIWGWWPPWRTGCW